MQCFEWLLQEHSVNSLGKAGTKFTGAKAARRRFPEAQVRKPELFEELEPTTRVELVTY